MNNPSEQHPRFSPPEDQIQIAQSPTAFDLASENRLKMTLETSKSKVDQNIEKMKQELGKRYSGCSIENWQMSDKPEVKSKQMSVLEKLNCYRESLSCVISQGSGLTLFGSIGTGKDHLMSALIFDAMRCGFTVEWRDGNRLYRDLRTVVSENATEADMIDPLISADVFAISDPLPPQGKLSPFIIEKLFSVVDRRHREQKATWLTLNVKSRNEADERLSPQIVDRITDGALCLACEWPSYRLGRRWTGGVADA